MGSIIHQGINLSFQIHYFSINASDCRNGISLAVYLIRCISAFYQLYIAFKYSNVCLFVNLFCLFFKYLISFQLVDHQP